MKILVLLLSSLICTLVLAEEFPIGSKETVFPARVSRINEIAKLVRYKIDFENSKFLVKKDRIELWNPTNPKNRCLGYMKGRTTEYLLVKIPNIEKCRASVSFAVGSYMHMYSPNLDNNLETARDLMDILNRKKTALGARKQRYERSITSYVEKIDTINKRYELLRQKLDLEWQKEISNLEEDKSKNYALLKQTDNKLNEIDFKMRQYRVRDQNMHEDRWSLDPNLYFRK